jgi:hypothetical protein
MMRSRALSVVFAVVLALLLGATAAAQPRDIFDPDDFLDPRELEGTFFISRLAAGRVWSYVDDFRPSGQDITFLYLTNSLYWNDMQFDYKHSEVQAENDPPDVILCGCSNRENPIYFPTPPPADAAPNPPAPGAKDTFQVARYFPWGTSADGVPIMLRSRLSYITQAIDTEVTSAATGEKSRLSGREQSFVLDTDTHFRIGERDFFGSLRVSTTTRSGTTEDRSYTEVAYKSIPPAISWNNVLFRGTLTVAGITNRGGPVLNAINPAVEVFWHDHHTRINFHFVVSPQITHGGSGGGWNTTTQFAVFVHRGLYLKIFGVSAKPEATPTPDAPPE